MGGPGSGRRAGGGKMSPALKASKSRLSKTVSSIKKMSPKRQQQILFRATGGRYGKA